MPAVWHHDGTGRSSDAAGRDDDEMSDYRSINHANWEARVPLHAASTLYDIERYRSDPMHLSSTVEFDLPRLGSVENLDVVHLQCHMGNDTLSLARLGAHATGLDFSESAIEVARDVSAAGGPHVDYVVADVYDAPDVLGRGRFDLVYTGIGALCWLPSVERWAATVAALLRRGGELFIREGHPVLWALDDPRPDGLVALEFPYFETDGVPFSEDLTYVEHEGVLSAPDIVHFNHGLAEIFNALWSNGMEITLFEEHDTVPWSALGDQMAEVADGEYRLIDRPERLPHSYTLRAVKR
jgi:2-polyprenyl-3-methyl-5-hydroxy-6-metoxy-1,4-benzoquinol methylase